MRGPLSSIFRAKGAPGDPSRTAVAMNAPEVRPTSYSIQKGKASRLILNVLIASRSNINLY
jgi:hypothetical protein